MALLAVLMMSVLATNGHAANSLGLGNPEPVMQPGGVFSGLLFWIQQQQQEFYRLTGDAMKLIRSGEGGMWLLVGLSFSYGVLHAAGPGHGKAVISSYVLANEVILRRGIMLSFASAALQAVVAIVAIGLLTLVLAGMGIKQSNFTRGLELASYGAITLLGAWLLFRKLRLISVLKGIQHDHSHHVSGHGQVHEDAHGHTHEPGRECPDCGHAHMPAPRDLEGKFGLREAWTAVLGVGLRPCSGALIVLTFAFLNGLYFAGIASAFAMALGTGITVAVIASMAVMAKSVALRISGNSSASSRVLWWIEIGGAITVLLLGATLLLAALAQ